MGPDWMVLGVVGRVTAKWVSRAACKGAGSRVVAMPAMDRGGVGAKMKSDMQGVAFRIVEDGGDDLHFGLQVLQGICGAKNFAVAGAAVVEEAERDPVT